MTRATIIGAGYTDFQSITPDVSWKEIMYKAASRAYDDAGINPRRDVKSFITCAEDYWEGFSIFDEFTPDQMGALLRPMITTCGDGIYGLANAFMQIKTGLMDVVAVESRSKISDLITYRDVVAGLEMRKYLEKTGTTEEECAHVAMKNKKNAMKNPLAGHEVDLTVDEVMESRYMSEPLKKLDIAPISDGAIVLVLASEEKAKELTDTPVWIRRIGWASDTPWLEQRGWSKAAYIESTSENTYKIVITGGLFSEGYISANGGFSISVSDGSIICVILMNTSKSHRALDAMFQLKEQAELRQVGCKTVTSILKREICN